MEIVIRFFIVQLCLIRKLKKFFMIRDTDSGDRGTNECMCLEFKHFFHILFFRSFQQSYKHRMRTRFVSFCLFIYYFNMKISQFSFTFFLVSMSFPLENNNNTLKISLNSNQFSFLRHRSHLHAIIGNALFAHDAGCIVVDFSLIDGKP